MKRLIPLVFIVLMLWVVPALAQNGNGVHFETPEWFVTILGFLSPVVIRLVNQHVGNSLARFAVSVALVVVVGVFGVLLTGQWDTTNIPYSIMMCFSACVVSYQLAWKPLFDALNKPRTLEAKTKLTKM